MKHITRSGIAALVVVTSALSVAAPSSAQSDHNALKQQRFIDQMAPQDTPPSNATRASTDLDNPSNAQAVSSIAATTRVVYQSFRDGNWEVYRTNGDFQGAVNLTNHPGSDTRPELSFNGQRIAFASNRSGNFEIYVMNVDGSGLINVTNTPSNEFSPSWAPDGKLAYVTDRDGQNEIYIGTVDGTYIERITTTPASEYGPSWSIDGKLSWAFGTGSSALGTAQIYDFRTSPVVAAQLNYLGSPIWSPDGDQIAFDGDADGDGFNELIVSALATGQVSIIRSEGRLIDAWAGSWSPDGGAIAYSKVTYSVSDNQLSKEKSETFVIAANGGVPGKAPGTERDELPSWRWIDTQPPNATQSELPSVSQTNVALTLRLGGADAGPAGLLLHQIQVYGGDANQGSWGPLRIVKGGRTNITGTTGFTIRVRARAVDRAGNASAWLAEQSILFYSVEVTGRILNNRGNPIPNVSVSSDMTTTLSVLSGQFFAPFTNRNRDSVQFTKPGYAVANYRSVLSEEMRYFGTVYLASEQNLIVNASFEGASGWTQGTATPELAQFAISDTKTLSNTPTQDQKFQMIETGCIALCVEPPRQIKPLIELSGFVPSQRTASVVDRAGIWHVFAVQPGYIEYASGQLTGTLSPTQTVSTFTSVVAPKPVGAFLDATDAPNLIYVDDGRLQHTRQIASGAWTTPVQIHDKPMTAQFQDRTNRMHLAECTETGTFERLKQITGTTWARYSGPPLNCSGTSVDRAGTAHIAYNDVGTRILYRTVSVDDQTSGEETAVAFFNSETNSHVSSVFVTVDGADTPHVIFKDRSNRTGYIYRNTDGTWSDVEYLTFSDGIESLRTDATGRLILIGPYRPPDGSALRINVATKLPGQPWSRMQRLAIDSLAGFERMNLIPSRDGRTYLQFRDYALAVRDQLPNIEGTVRQSVTIPAAMPRPTLAFLQRLKRVGPGDAVIVRVNDGLTDTLVYSDTAESAQWRVASVDMSAFAGRTITVSVGLRQTARSGTAMLALDYVTLGPATAPEIRDVTATPQSGGRTTLMISGANFAPGVIVQLNGRTIDGITRDSEGVLQVAPASGVPPGRYTVSVRNPDGDESAWRGLLTVGRQTYLPLTEK
jgi:hypothetical protein